LVEFSTVTPDASRPTAEPDHSMRVRVYYEDTDAGGIVYHANWLRWFERARTDWLRSLGFEHSRMLSTSGIGLVVRDLCIDYRRPASLDEELIVDVSLVDARRASWLLDQRAWRPGDAGPLVTARLRIAAVHLATGKPTGIPKDIATRALASRGASQPRTLHA
jgi:acyl-CoA thioester hydrolase